MSLHFLFCLWSDDGWWKQSKHAVALNKEQMYYISTVVFVCWCNTLITISWNWAFWWLKVKVSQRRYRGMSRDIWDSSRLFFFPSIRPARKNSTPTGQILLKFDIVDFNSLKPNDPYRGRTAPLTSKRYISYIYSTNTEWPKKMYTHFDMKNITLYS